jgi:hypothetical protein
MPDRPPRIPREEPDSDAPPKREEHRPVFVTRHELGFALSQLKREIHGMMSDEVTKTVGVAVEKAIVPVRGSLDRLEQAATAQRIYNDERRRRREEEKEDLELDIVRAKLDSQNDEREFIKAQTEKIRLQTSPPFEVPHAIDGTRSKRIAIATAIITALTAIIVAAIGAYASQHSSPHGVVEHPPIVTPLEKE